MIDRIPLALLLSLTLSLWSMAGGRAVAAPTSEVAPADTAPTATDERAATADMEQPNAEIPTPPTAGDITRLQGLGDLRYHLLESALLGRDLHIFVRLPEGYGDGTESYPTVYLLDGGLTFPMLAGYYRYLKLAEEVPAAILVGISYGTEDRQQGNLRSTDFTAPSEEREHWGGAANFQRMFATELLPLMESTYRSDRAQRILFGQSLGGQFVLFAAQTQPALFRGYIASNPALHRNLDFFLETHPGVRPTDRARVFVSSAENDDPRFRQPALAWMAHWKARDPLPWDLETRTLGGHGHFSAAPAAFRQGMTWLFETP